MPTASSWASVIAPSRTSCWILGGDNVADTEEKKTIWNLVAKGITEGVAGSEDYGRTIMTYHCPGGNSSSQWFHAAPWLDFNMIQTWS